MHTRSMYEIEDVDWEENLESDAHKSSIKCSQTESPSNLDLYTLFPEESNFQHINEVLTVPTNERRTPVTSIEDDQMNMHGGQYYGNSESPAIFSENNKSGLKRNRISMETSFLDCEWDEFGNFDLFSGSTGSADEFSWFSSPRKYDRNSSNSALNPSNGSSELYEADMNFFLEDEACDHSEWMQDMDQMKSTISQHESEIGTKSGSYSSYSRQKIPFHYQMSTDSAVESEHGSNIYPFSEYKEKSVGKFVNESSRSASTTNCMHGQISEKMHPLTLQINQSNTPISCQNDQNSDAELAEKHLEVSKFEMDYSTRRNQKKASVLCDDGSLGSSCFMKLQDLMGQLDSTTKLCIRDGMYRLARNAEIRGICSSNETPIAQESNQPSEHLVETGTNAIDRSIAQLLFYRASDSH